MGTTIDKLSKLLETKQAIKQAINDKGGNVGDNFSTYPTAIANLSGGGDSYYEDLWNASTSNDTNYSYLFYFSNAAEIDVSKLDTSNVTNMYYMFYNCSSLTSLDVSNFNTSKVTNMQYMFNSCSSLTSLDVSKWDTSNVTVMTGLFSGCNSLTSIDVSSWNISNVTKMSGIFNSCGFTSLDVSSWDVGHITSSNYGMGILACGNLVDFKAPKNINADFTALYSDKLSHDSLMSIINNLMATTSTKNLMIGEANLAKLTDEEKAIATNKGWTIK